MKTILVIANETLGGAKLFDAVKARVDAAPGDTRFVLCVPRTNPRHGNVIYADAVFEAAQVRIDLARAYLRDRAGIDVIGEVGDPDPYTATMDAVAEYQPDEIIVSTYPATSSGWLRRDLIERIERRVGAAGRARGRRPRRRRPAVRRHAGGREPHRQPRRDGRPPEGQGRRTATACSSPSSPRRAAKASRSVAPASDSRS